jgi:outer membrane receptor protein involved in Fe transport
MFLVAETRPSPLAAGRIPPGQPTQPPQISNRESAIRKTRNSLKIRTIIFSNREYIAVFQSSFSGVSALLALILILFAAPLQAQGVRVEGTVRDSTGASVPGAQVELRAKSYTAVAITDSAGAFAFEHVPETSCTFIVTATGFERLEKDWTTAAANNPTTPLDITLAPSQLAQRITVTATRSQTLLSDVPMSDIQLTRDDVQSIPALNLDDALRQVPGFSLFRRSSSRNANPTAQGLSLRGLGASGSSRALVLEDGIPLNDPFGAWIFWDRVPRESIANVEIAQEGASSLYGSDALGGVLQVLTRGPEPGGISLETSYGNQNSPELSLWGGAQKNGWETTFGAQVFHTDGYILIPEDQRGSVDTRAGVSDATLDLMVGHKIGTNSEVFARGWYFNESRNNGTPVQINNTRIGQGALGANLDLGAAGSLTLRFYGEAERYNQTFSSVATDRNSEALTDLQGVPSQGIGGSAVWSRHVGHRQTLVAGLDEHQEIGHSNEVIFNSGNNLRDSFTGGHQRTIGVFGEDLIQIAPRWLLSLSARYDNWNNTDAFFFCTPVAGTCPANKNFPDRTNNAFSPRATLQHQFNSNVAWSASIYRAFRAPTLNELYRSFRQGNTITNANSNLRSEQLTGGDASVAVNGFNHKLEARGTFFYNYIIDPVANVTCSPTSPPPCTAPIPNTIVRARENIGRSKAPGFELNTIAHFTRTFDLSVGYQFVAATVDGDPANPALVGLWIAQVPRNVLTFQARYLNPTRINVSINGRMVGKQFDDDQNQFPLGRFFVLDAMAWRSIGQGIELFTAAENLFNVKYDTAATPIPQLGLPITARFGLRFQFPRR